MRRFDYLYQRLKRLEPEPEYVEPWPPLEGSLEWAILEGMKADGIEVHDKPANETGLMFLLGLEAPRLWGDYQ